MATFFLIQYLWGAHHYRSLAFFKNIKSNSEKYRIFERVTLVCFCLGFASTTTDLFIGKWPSFKMARFENKGAFVAFIGRFILVNSNILSRVTAYINCATFLLNVLWQRKHMTKFIDYVSNDVSFDISVSEKTSIVAQEYTRVRENWNDVVNAFNIFYTSMCIFGFVTLFFVVKNKSNTMISLVSFLDVGIFLTVNIILIFSICSTHETAKEVRKKTRTGEMVRYCLETPMRNVRNINEYTNSQLRDMSSEEAVKYDSLAQMIQNRTGHVVQWIFLQMAIDSEWEAFGFLGFEMTDKTLIVRVLGVFLAFGVGKEMKLF